MLRTLLYAFCIFALWALFGRWYYTCRIKVCDCCEIGATAQNVRASTLQLSKANAPAILKGFEQFSFAQNAIAPDLNANNEKFLAETIAYLKANPNETLTITACSRKNEPTELGANRANAIKEALVKLGGNAAQIKTTGCISDDNLSTAAAFAMSGGDTTAAANNGNTAAANTTPAQDSYLNITISDENFDFNSAVFKPKQDFVNKANQLKAYAASRPNITMSIVGHTDNVGNDAYNLALGKRRADAVRQYFNRNGLKIKINTDSKGESQPVASNDDEAGRATNRRVNCNIIQ